MKTIYEENDPCPICNTPLVEEVDSNDNSKLVCPEDDNHFSHNI